MKRLLIFVIAMTVIVSCSHSEKKRSLASKSSEDITRLGVVKYPSTKVNWLNQTIPTNEKYRAARLYLKEIPNEQGSYYALLLEYHELKKVLKEYLRSKREKRADRLGYLNQICSRIHLYKAVPTGDDKVFNLYTAIIGDKNQIVAAKNENPSQLIMTSRRNPLAGAKITASPTGEPTEIFFPKGPALGLHGTQYNMAQMTYKDRAIDMGLNSTWRNSFLPGPYLGSYENKKHHVLTLSKGNANMAKFVANKPQEFQLTNSKSAEILGDYKVIQLSPGIFYFLPQTKNQPGSEVLKGRFGMFVDIFDASKTVLNQDVVELILTNPSDNEDFLMYYEHPENGEGRDARN